MNNETEMGSFTPLVFSTLRGGVGHTAQCRILQKTCSPCLSSEGVVSYSSVMSGWWQGVLVTLGIIIKNLNKKISCIRSSIVLEWYS